MNNIQLNQTVITVECEFIKAFLLEKNKKYGDSALNPLQIFSKLNPVKAIESRIDDKLKRIKNGNVNEDEDLILDLIGYLILYRIAFRQSSGDYTGPSDIIDFPIK